MNFQEWKEDLLVRCNEHLIKYPEFKSKTSLTTIPHAQVRCSGNTRLEIKESINFIGAWGVWKNGVLKQTFFYPDAHLKAMRYMNELLSDGDEYPRSI